MTTPVVSGPGALSRRTDTGPAQKLRDLPDADYGEGATYKDLQRQAPLAQDPRGGQPSPAAVAAAAAAQQVVPIDAASTEPGTPVTDGAEAGPGGGMGALGLIPQTDQDYAMMADDLAVLEFMASQPGASWATRNLVRRLKATNT